MPATNVVTMNFIFKNYKKLIITKQKFGKSFMLIPIGLFLLSGIMAITRFKTIPNIVSGFLFGTGIGLMMLPFIFKRIKPTNP
jgi:hypothetical protein